MSKHQTELHKEFELERTILFSDAVFAIAITLIIIEIKFPEVPEGATASVILKAFKPVPIQFFGFIISFFFVGTLWTRHLRLFRYLVKYDAGLVRRNLFFLFFIVCFPFSASGITEQLQPGYTLPLVIYMFNISSVFICQSVLCTYIFKTHSQLTADGFLAEKKYLVKQSSWIAVAISSVTIIYLLVSLFFPFNQWGSELLFITFAGLMGLMRRRLNKYKPATMKGL